MLNVTKTDTWKATLEDRPGALSGKLEDLAKTGADLEFIIARRSASQPGSGVVFVTPLSSEAQITAARKLGFDRSRSVQVVRVEGHDEPGIGFLITRAVAAEGINLRGFSASRQGSQFVAFLAFDNTDDANNAVARLNRPL